MLQKKLAETDLSQNSEDGFKVCKGLAGLTRESFLLLPYSKAYALTYPSLMA